MAKDVVKYTLQDLNNGRGLTKNYTPERGNHIKNGRFGNYYYPNDVGTPMQQKEPILLNMNDGYEYRLENWDRFNRWYTINVDEETTPTRHYIFFCRPDLYLLDPTGRSLSSESRVNKDPYFIQLFNERPEIVKSLCAEYSLSTTQSNSSTKSYYSGMYANGVPTGSGYGNAVFLDGTKNRSGSLSLPLHSLVPFLTGRVESLQVPDYNVKTYTLTQPYTKYSLPFAVNAIESTTGGTFDVSFREDKDLSVTKYFYSWLYYMDGVSRNIFKPKDKYILYNALDYATSVYDVLVDATGERIVWFGKYTGVIPTSVPTSDLSWSKGGTPNSALNISFAYFHFEQMNPEILIDLNYNSLGYAYMNKLKDTSGTLGMDYMSIYNEYEATTGVSMVGRPFITRQSNQYYLRWAVPPNGTATQSAYSTARKYLSQIFSHLRFNK